MRPRGGEGGGRGRGGGRGVRGQGRGGQRWRSAGRIDGGCRGGRTGRYRSDWVASRCRWRPKHGVCAHGCAAAKRLVHCGRVRVGRSGLRRRRQPGLSGGAQREATHNQNWKVRFHGHFLGGLSLRGGKPGGWAGADFVAGLAAGFAGVADFVSALAGLFAPGLTAFDPPVVVVGAGAGFAGIFF